MRGRRSAPPLARPPPSTASSVVISPHANVSAPTENHAPRRPPGQTKAAAWRFASCTHFNNLDRRGGIGGGRRGGVCGVVSFETEKRGAEDASGSFARKSGRCLCFRSAKSSVSHGRFPRVSSSCCRARTRMAPPRKRDSAGNRQAELREASAAHEFSRRRFHLCTCLATSSRGRQWAPATRSRGASICS